jgi:hypothetical protein
MLQWWGKEIVIHPNMGIMRVHNIVPCGFRLISKQDVSYKLCVYGALEHHHPRTAVKRSEGLHSQDVITKRSAESLGLWTVPSV